VTKPTAYRTPWLAAPRSRPGCCSGRRASPRHLVGRPLQPEATCNARLVVYVVYVFVDPALASLYDYLLARTRQFAHD
jgi:hypothetical protein